MCNFKATNNKSEYEASIAGLTLTLDMGAETVVIITKDVTNKAIFISFQVRNTFLLIYVLIALLPHSQHSNFSNWRMKKLTSYTK